MAVHEMDESEVMAALSGLHAYDSGAVSSGIHDELLRAHVTEYVRSLSMSDRRVLMARIARELFLTDRAISQGYGLEDAQKFADWLDEHGILI
jgi:hypothetical protein